MLAGALGLARTVRAQQTPRANTRRMERSRVTLNTIALELVPPNADEGRERALEEAHKVVRHSAESGLTAGSGT